MKARPIPPAAMLLWVVLFAAQTAQAFYNPNTGRWLSRDPIGEAGFVLLTEENSSTAEQDGLGQEFTFATSDNNRLSIQAGGRLYAFVDNSPAGLIDSLGLTVYIQAHPVALGMNHSKVTMVVECDSRWYNTPPFTRLMPGNSDQYYATIGAGPIRRLLVSDLNRERDVQLWRNIFSTLIPPPAGVSEDDFIEQLIAADSRYPDNLPYAFFPPDRGGRYNSNSYVSGILNAVTGSMPPQPPRTPGFRRPVPWWYFE